jgi:hypothetical protein
LENKLWDNITGIFELDLPQNLEDLAAHIEYIVPRVQQWSEDLWEEQYYTNKRWKEIRDTDTYHEVVLHIFMPGGEYMVSIDGDLSKGGWRYLKDSNTFIVDYGGKSQLFDLVFLNSDFFILEKHGDQDRKGKQKYYVYGNEGTVGKLDWRNAMEALYNIYRTNSRFSTWLFLTIFLIIAIIYISLNM